MAPTAVVPGVTWHTRESAVNQDRVAESGSVRHGPRESVRERERERERQREGQCVDMNEGSVVKAVLNEVQIREFDESVPVYIDRLGS